MKTLSFNQLQLIEKTINEINNGTYHYDHLQQAYNLIEKHNDGWDYFTPSIMYWYDKFYQTALLTALKREADRKKK